MHQNPSTYTRFRARKSSRRLLRRVAAGCYLAIALAQARAAAPARPGSVTHVVILWLKRPENGVDRAALARASEEFRKIPGVLNVGVSDPLPVQRPGIEERFDLCVLFRFQDRAALARFEKDPRHTTAVKSVLKPLVKRFVVFNSVVD